MEIRLAFQPGTPRQTPNQLTPSRSSSTNRRPSKPLVWSRTTVLGPRRPSMGASVETHGRVMHGFPLCALMRPWVLNLWPGGPTGLCQYCRRGPQRNVQMISLTIYFWMYSKDSLTHKVCVNDQNSTLGSKQLFVCAIWVVTTCKVLTAIHFIYSL